jgi:hypothetical protein
MRIVKIIVLSIWIVLIISLAMLLISQRTIIKIQDNRINVLIKQKMLPVAELSSEYYQNFKLLGTKPELKKLTDSLFNKSEFLKSYDKVYKKKDK